MSKFKTKIAHLNDKWSNEMFTTHGWLVHYVFDAEGTGFDSHTHGLLENFNHTDLQCVLPLSQDILQGTFNTVVHLIKNGETFIEGQSYENVLSGGYKVEFISVTSDGRDLLRLILPDGNGLFPSDVACNPNYKIQYLGSRKSNLN